MPRFDGARLSAPTPAPANSHAALPPPERRVVKRRRRKRLRRRAYIRSVHFLPTLATLGNAVSGFAAIYVAGLEPALAGTDSVAIFLAEHRFAAACYLIFLAALFDALDGRLARFTRHTTDFGAQLDSLADVISFGAAPAFIALQVFKSTDALTDLPLTVTRLVWAVGALFLSCAALRLARFNVSNEHGEQHHLSFLGLPTPGAGGAVVAYILFQQYVRGYAGPPPGGFLHGFLHWLDLAMVLFLPVLVGGCGLLMVSGYRYPHLVNRYLRVKGSFGRLLMVIALLLLLIVAHQATLAVVGVGYAAWGLVTGVWVQLRSRRSA